MNLYEEKLYDEYKLVAGTDEAGRGPLAGPLVVAACMLPIYFNDEIIKDSKKLTEKQREKAYHLIISNALCYSIRIFSSEDVDELNPLAASRLGMIECLHGLTTQPDLYLTDAIDLNKYIETKTIPLIHGDALSKNIAAASIIAKYTRDQMMIKLGNEHPEYLFAKNKGYGTKAHIDAINTYGIIKGVHRESYEPIKSMLKK